MEIKHSNLKKRIVDELHKPARKNFYRRNVVLKGINDLYQADLIEMRPHSKINNGYNYILTVINCFTKLADALPIKDKTAFSVTEAMKRIILRDKYRMKLLQTDNGTEYYNKVFNKLMNKYNIKHYSTNSEIKASIIERFNRTLKNDMYKMFSQKGSYRWYDSLPDLIKQYNNRYHRTIGMKPTSVNANNEDLVLQRIKKNTKPAVDKKKAKNFYEGDKVRISKYKQVFSKGYIPNWTNEVFTVYRVQPTTPTTYLLKDNKGELLQGGFYGHEMLLSTVGDVYLVEKILKRKKDKVLVRWLGFDKKHDSWITTKDLV